MFILYVHIYYVYCYVRTYWKTIQWSVATAEVAEVAPQNSGNVVYICMLCWGHNYQGRNHSTGCWHWWARARNGLKHHNLLKCSCGRIAGPYLFASSSPHLLDTYIRTTLHVVLVIAHPCIAWHYKLHITSVCPFFYHILCIGYCV